LNLMLSSAGRYDFGLVRANNGGWGENLLQLRKTSHGTRRKNSRTISKGRC
jgi:hypothetical protein